MRLASAASSRGTCSNAATSWLLSKFPDISLPLHLLECDFGLVHGAVAGGRAAIGGRLQDDLLEIILAQVAGREARAHMQPELVPARERDHDRQDHKAARPGIDAGPRPDIAP